MLFNSHEFLFVFLPLTLTNIRSFHALKDRSLAQLPSLSSPRVSRICNEWSVHSVILALALLTLALSIHGLARLRDAAIALVRNGDGITVGRLVRTIDATDLVLAVASLAALGLLVLWERRFRAISRMLAADSPVNAVILLTIAGGWLGQAYLFPGVLLGGDSGGHISRFLEMRLGFEGGTVPQWTNYQYLGEPLLGFTGPFTYVVGGALDVLVRDPVLTAKIILFFTHVAAGWLFYALLRRLDFSPFTSVVAAIGFGGSFALLHLFIFRGVFPQAFTILFLTPVFYAAEGLMRGTPHVGRTWLMFALSTAGLIVNHQPHALFAGLFLALFGAASVALGRWTMTPGSKWILSAGVAGVAISVFAVVPIAVESNWVMIDPSGQGGLIQLEWPSAARLAQLVVWRNSRTNWGTDYWAYLGIVLVALALLGTWSALSGALGKDRRRLALAILPCFVLSFVLTNPVVRNVIFIVFFSALYAALGVERLLRGSASAGRVMLLVLLAVILDTGSTSVQPIARTDKQYLVDAGLYFERKAPDQRVLEGDVAQDGSFDISIGPNATPMSYYSTVQRVAGEHNMAATLVHNYVETAAKLAALNLRRDGHLGSDAEAIMQMLNVSRVVCSSPFANGCPKSFAGLETEGPLGDIVPIPSATPAVFSQRLVALAPDAGLDKPMLWNEDFSARPREPRVDAIVQFLHRFVAVEDVAPGSHMAASLAARALPAAGPSPPAEGIAWHPRVVAYSVGLQRVHMTVASDGYGFAQLAHPWYPASEVTINGQRIVPLAGSIGLMLVPIVPGDNRIEIAPVLTPIRVATSAISIASLLLAVAAAGMIGHRAQRRHRARKNEGA